MPARSDAMVKRLTLIACILGSGIALLDGTVVNVALPTIQRALGGGLAAQQWVVNGYLLTLGSLILVGGSLGDLYGERKVFALGVAGFGVASALCAASPSIGVLVAARALQGIAGALLVPSSLAVIVNTFPASERGGAIGTWTAWGAIAGVLGPLAGGELLAIASWRWIFVINVPLAAACVWLILSVIPPSAARERRRAARRLPGRAAVRAGPRRPGVRADRAAAAGLVEPGGRRAADRRRAAARGVHVVRVAREGSDAAAGAVPPAQLLGRQRRDVRDVRGAGDPVLLPRAVPAADRRLLAAEERAGDAAGDDRDVRCSRGASARWPIATARASSWAPGRSIGAVGLLLFQNTGLKADYVSEVLPPLLIFSLGLSMTVAPLTAAVLAGSEKEAGIASGVNNAIARVAGLLGTAAVGAAIASSFVASMNSRLAGVALGNPGKAAVAQAKRLPLGRPDVHGMPSAQAHAVTAAAEGASLHSFHLGMAIAAGLVALGGLVGAAGIRNPRKEQEEIHASSCPGGQLVGSSSDIDWPEEREDVKVAV